MSKVIAFVVGDAITDSYQEVRARRFAPDAPAPVWEADGAPHLIPGGALNVARQFHYLNAEAYFAGYGGGVFRDCESARLRTLSRFGHAPVKMRFCSAGHVLARFDVPGSDVSFDYRDKHARAAIQACERRLVELGVSDGTAKSGGKAVAVFSDYRLGFWDGATACAAHEMFKRYGVPIVVDAKPGGINFLQMEGLACVKLNEAEAAALVRGKAGEPHECGRELAELANAPVVVTRGAKPPYLCTARTHDPCGEAINSDRPLWASGAGDCFTAYLAASVAREGRITTRSVARAHEAGAVYVTKKYNAAVHPREIAERFKIGGAKAYHDYAELAERIQALPPNSRIGYTNGVYDLLHAGHLSCLEWARRQCDFLVVFVNTDASAERCKGQRPFLDVSSRVDALSALACVDAVTHFDEAEPTRAFQAVGSCDVLVKGAEYAGTELAGREFAKKVLLAPETVRMHTTDLVRMIQKAQL